MTFQQGRFIPKNPMKYKGNNLNDIRFRSGWERKAMVHFDINPNILEWASESVVIPYISPIDAKKHRYFPDFYVKLKQKDGIIKTFIFEVKPYAQTKEPVKKTRSSKRYLYEVFTWGVNSAKWQAAMEYCDHMGWEFRILSESDLGL